MVGAQDTCAQLSLFSGGAVTRYSERVILQREIDGVCVCGLVWHSTTVSVGEVPFCFLKGECVQRSNLATPYNAELPIKPAQFCIRKTPLKASTRLLYKID